MKGHSSHNPAPFTRLAQTLEDKARKLYARGQAREFEHYTFTIVRPQGNLIGVISIAPEILNDTTD